MDLKEIIEKYDGEYVFIAMPFIPRFNEINDIIKHSCEQCSIFSFRVDELMGSRNIEFEIMGGFIEQILK